ncbi:NAD-dependent epimerase/dehydratase family protein [Neorhizobium galegae]|uniref:NAD-dependent epimerase/dehydratase family protein n=1 Tax=Neorhizobium galegae TaxID=399 RepID=UPI00062236F3|nr:NAD-dependent epimerase/dehydratase family protein [Neorhizobium galegae]MCQ1836179.1 NAD(P)H-binding protein [Neorhizobium galegae]CDZ69665.1 NADPH-dependent glutamate synthase beta chain and oxidoreductase [Neorhizobium galegae bv. orientalis]
MSGLSNSNPGLKPIALVLGATGGIGGHVARGLAARGWTVRALNRKAGEAAKREPRFHWLQGDAMNAADVRRAAQDARLIVHAVNPPGYKDWEKLVLPMLDNTIAAARAVGARILLPGTVYNYGPDVFPEITEESPQNPVTRKGAIRVELERRLEVASNEGVPVLIVRAGDYFGPGAANSWFTQGMVKPGKPVGSVTRPSAEGVGHQWAYLPDVAETMLRLIDREDELPRFARFQMRGFWDRDGGEVIAAIGRVVGQKPKVKAFSWWLLKLGSPFVPIFRELGEMRYLWKVPVRMSNDKLRAFLGEEPSTPIDEAIRTTLADLGCIEPKPAKAAKPVALLA